MAQIQNGGFSEAKSFEPQGTEKDDNIRGSQKPLLLLRRRTHKSHDLALKFDRVIIGGTQSSRVFRDFPGCGQAIKKTFYFGKDLDGWMRAARLMAFMFGLLLNVATVGLSFQEVYTGDTNTLEDISFSDEAVVWLELVAVFGSLFLLVVCLFLIFRFKSFRETDHRLGNIFYISFKTVSGASLFMAIQIFRPENVLSRIRSLTRRTRFLLSAKGKGEALLTMFFEWALQIALTGAAIFALVFKVNRVAAFWNQHDGTWTSTEIVLALGFLNQAAETFDENRAAVRAVLLFVFTQDGRQGLSEQDLVTQEQFTTFLFAALAAAGDDESGGGSGGGAARRGRGDGGAWWRRRARAAALFLTLNPEDVGRVLLHQRRGGVKGAQQQQG